MTVSEFAQNIQTIASNANISCTSWGRTDKRNKEVGGVENSLHLVWLAVDVVPDTEEDRKKTLHWVNRLGLRAITYKDSNHIHIQVPHIGGE